MYRGCPACGGLGSERTQANRRLDSLRYIIPDADGKDSTFVVNYPTHEALHSL